MSLLEQASLIVTPNAYKEDVLYSVVPNDRSGDLDVVRATTATRVNADGLIEVVPKNLASYSEQFDNVVWSKSNTTVTANSITAPNGTLTADTITESTANAIHNISQSVSGYTSGTIITFSFYVKANGRNSISLGEFNNIGDNSKSIYDLSNGIITGKGSLVLTATIVKDTATNWCFCTMSFVSISTNSFYPQFRLINNLGQEYYVGDGVSGVYLWGFQATQSSIPKDYFPTTDRLNIPRLDYSGGGCPSILVEGQRTNLALWSEDFSNAYWTKQAITLTANNTEAPDGNTTAALISANTTNGEHNVYSNLITITPNVDYTCSYFVKKGTGRYIAVAIYYNGVTTGFGAYATYDLSTNTLVASGAPKGTFTGTKIETFANGWVKISVTGKGNSAGARVDIDIRNAANLVPQVFFTGANETFYIWGAQLEAGSNATSYIPTIASTVTRNADVISKTGISDLIGQTEGTIFVDIDLLSNNSRFFSISELLFNLDSIRMEYYYPKLYFIAMKNNTNPFNIVSSMDYTIGNQYKLCLKYSSSSIKVFINGILDTEISGSYTIPTSSIIAINQLYGFSSESFQKNNFNSVQLYKTALTDEQCINLTTL